MKPLSCKVHYSSEPSLKKDTKKDRTMTVNYGKKGMNKMIFIEDDIGFHPMLRD
jgi:hypothetical protein